MLLSSRRGMPRQRCGEGVAISQRLLLNRAAEGDTDVSPQVVVDADLGLVSRDGLAPYILPHERKFLSRCLVSTVATMRAWLCHNLGRRILESDAFLRAAAVTCTVLGFPCGSRQAHNDIGEQRGHVEVHPRDVATRRFCASAVLSAHAHRLQQGHQLRQVHRGDVDGEGPEPPLAHRNSIRERSHETLDVVRGAAGGFVAAEWSRQCERAHR
mmetsp:Transcript_75363/g.245107  ORF Transcript_75363/g.245107 Transcript_75363/m.245107 type:complete len:213 (+) Transcript_75363:1396-2034(+)